MGEPVNGGFFSYLWTIRRGGSLLYANAMRIAEPFGRTTACSTTLGGHVVYNLPPPTQGLASLLLLALYEALRARQVDSFDFVHRLVECTKVAFVVRDRYVTDPAHMICAAEDFLTPESLRDMAADRKSTRLKSSH